MKPPDIRKVLGLLQEAGIPVCTVGELVLNYYNAPRVIHGKQTCLSEQMRRTTISTRSTNVDFPVFVFAPGVAPVLSCLPTNTTIWTL